MSFIKQIRDMVAKRLFQGKVVPQGLVDLHDYFRRFPSIEFIYQKSDDLIIAKSKNFRFGSIMTTGKTLEEVDRNIKDAILTSFEIPSAYAQEAQITRTGENTKDHQYALAL